MIDRIHVYVKTMGMRGTILRLKIGLWLLCACYQGRGIENDVFDWGWAAFFKKTVSGGTVASCALPGYLIRKGPYPYGRIS